MPQMVIPFSHRIQEESPWLLSLMSAPVSTRIPKNAQPPRLKRWGKKEGEDKLILVLLGSHSELSADRKKTTRPCLSPTGIAPSAWRGASIGLPRATRPASPFQVTMCRMGQPPRVSANGLRISSPATLCPCCISSEYRYSAPDTSAQARMWLSQKL